MTIGDTITLIDPAAGSRHKLTVAGIDGDLDPTENGAMVAAPALSTFVDRSFAGRFYVAVRDGADPSAVGARLKGELLANGVKADTFRSLVDDRLRGTTAFIRLLEGFLALGLVIGIRAGVGVVMVRAVRERRREIGMLRAMGFASKTVRRAFLIEATFIAAQGIVIGGVLGLVTGYSVLSNSSALGDKTLPFTVAVGRDRDARVRRARRVAPRRRRAGPPGQPHQTRRRPPPHRLISRPASTPGLGSDRGTSACLTRSGSRTRTRPP